MTLSDILVTLGTFERRPELETPMMPLFLEDRTNSPLIRFVRIFSLRATQDLTEDRVSDLVLSVDCDRLTFFQEVFPKKTQKLKRKRTHAKVVCHVTQDEIDDLLSWT